MRRNGGGDESEKGSRQNGSPRSPFARSRAVPLRRLAWLGVAAVVACLLGMTLWPRSHPQGINLIPFRDHWPEVACLLHSCRWAKDAGVFLFVDVVGNLAMFVPFGAALAVATLPPRAEGRAVRNFGSRWWSRIVAAGFLFSVSIELAQLLMPSRLTNVDDVILNTLGAAVGAAVVWGSYRLTSTQ